MTQPTEPSGTEQAAFEAMLRRYAAKLLSRYAPVLAVGLVLLLVLLLVPTTQPSSTTTAGGVGFGVGASGGNGAGNGSAAGAGAAGGAGSASGAVGGGGGAGSASGGGGGGGGADTSGFAGPTPGVPFTGSSSGVAVTGVHCGSGVRQFTWSKYAPPCVSHFTGNNGGATAHGVTPNTITLTYRLANSAQQAAISAAAGAANINESDLVADMKSYAAFFNTQFELYGRHVEIKTYQGQGDYIQEDQGQDLGATQSDAVQAHDIGAFGDVTFALEASQPYEEDLAAEHVISFSSVGLSQQWFDQHAPYEYSTFGPSGSVGLDESVAVICRWLAGMPAVFSGNAADTKRNRVFGIIYPQTPVYQAEVNQAKAEAAQQCGVKPAATIGYAINVAGFEQESVSAVDQMRAAGVTTVLCACDPIVPIFLTNAANQQGYYPEWFTTSFGDPVSREYNKQEWSHTVAGGIQFPPPTQTEAYHAFQLGFPGKQPAEEPPSSPPYFYVPYYTLLQVFDALQAAGPNLTPATFEAAMFSLPASTPGDNVEGQWVFGNRIFDPVWTFQIVWWDPNAVSAFDNTQGAYRWCNNAATYSHDNLAALGGPHQQLSCFGH